MQQRKPVFYRLSQFIGFLLGARFFVTLLLTFALYVSTFFLFNHEESLKQFVFDLKIHGIIFCAILSILAGGIINQFYDREKDHLTKPFRTKLQSFLQQKYFLYAYVILNILSLLIAMLISSRVLFFFIVYQFFMWFYSHKLSKIPIVNNITFVSLTLYPFFGMLIYYQTFSVRIFFMASFLFLILLVIDVIKDTLTRNADKIFEYFTIPNYFGAKTTKAVLLSLLVSMGIVSAFIAYVLGWERVMSWYFITGLGVIIWCVIQLWNPIRNTKFIMLNVLRLWVFVGIIAMLADGILQKY